MRTTVDIDPSVLEAVKLLARERRQTLGSTLSVLLARALADEQKGRGNRQFWWPSKPMGALVDLEDKETLWRILDSDAESDA